MNILERLEQVFERYGNRTFLIDSLGDRSLTFRQFRLSAGHGADKLYGLGVRRHDRVVMVLHNSAEFASLYFSCLFLGATAVPVNPALHHSEIEFIIHNSGGKLVIYSPSTAGLVLPALQTAKHPESICLLPAHEKERPAPQAEKSWDPESLPESESIGIKSLEEVRPDDLFSITFTSGTTGVPKGVAHRAESLLGNALLFDQELEITPENRFLHVFPMGYMAGFLNSLLCPFMAGASLVLSPAFNITTAIGFWRTVVKHQVNTLWVSPSMLSILLKMDRDPAGPSKCLENIKLILVSTETLPTQLKEDFEAKYGTRLLESYGLSELLLITANFPGLPGERGSVGRLLRSVRARIADDNGQQVPEGSAGEIMINTPHLMAGYLDFESGRPDPSTAPEWFPTGDVGFISGEGNLFITGRKKDLIIRGGINISPQVIEEVVLRHQWVEEAAAVGIADTSRGEQVVVALKPAAGKNLEDILLELEEICKYNLSRHALPDRFVEVEEIPRTRSGKIEKEKLRRMLTQVKPAG